MPRTFILIAHRSGARLFKQDHVHAPLALHTQFDFPKGRLQEGEINADRPGRCMEKKVRGRWGGGRARGLPVRDRRLQ